MRITPAGLALIQRWESCKLSAYLDSGGLPTIGWGTTRYPDGTRVQLGDICTQEQADMWLRSEVSYTEKLVDDLTTDSLRPEQFDALVCFTYNVGVSAFRRSTLRRLVNTHSYDPGIPQAFRMWVYDNGKFVQGLMNRRNAEIAHYLGGLS